MKLYVDLETLQVIEGPGFRNPLSSIRFKRGDAAKLEVVFLDGGLTATTIGDAAQLHIQFGAKADGRYGSDYLVLCDTFTMPGTTGSPVYSCAPSFNSTALNDALHVGAANELATIALMGEITWHEGAGEPTSTRTFLMIVENDVNRGSEGAPVPTPNVETWLGTKAVRHDTQQVLDDTHRFTARRNIGASGGTFSDTGVPPFPSRAHATFGPLEIYAAVPGEAANGKVIHLQHSTDFQTTTAFNENDELVISISQTGFYELSVVGWSGTAYQVMCVGMMNDRPVFSSVPVLMHQGTFHDGSVGMEAALWHDGTSWRCQIEGITGVAESMAADPFSITGWTWMDLGMGDVTARLLGAPPWLLLANALNVEIWDSYMVAIVDIVWAQNSITDTLQDTLTLNNGRGEFPGVNGDLRVVTNAFGDMVYVCEEASSDGYKWQSITVDGWLRNICLDVVESTSGGSYPSTVTPIGDVSTAQEFAMLGGYNLFGALPVWNSGSQVMTYTSNRYFLGAIMTGEFQTPFWAIIDSNHSVIASQSPAIDAREVRPWEHPFAFCDWTYGKPVIREPGWFSLQVTANVMPATIIRALIGGNPVLAENAVLKWGAINDIYTETNFYADLKSFGNNSVNPTTPYHVINRQSLRGLFLSTEADQPLQNTTAFTAWTGGTMQLENGTYHLTGILILTPQAAAMGAKISLNDSGGFNGSLFGRMTIGYGTTLSTVPIYATGGSLAAYDQMVAGGATGSTIVVEIDVIARISWTSMLGWKFAQATANAGSLIARKGGFLRAVRIN